MGSYDAEFEGLEKVILLAEGAKMLLTCNIWTSKGLVYGAKGVVRRFGLTKALMFVVIFQPLFLSNSMDTLDCMGRHYTGTAMFGFNPG